MTENAKDKLAVKILCLEDSSHDIRIIREQLQDAGYELTMECTAKKEEYISLLRDHRFDVILSNFTISDFNAFDALRIAHEISPETPFICISGLVGEETAVELILQGAADYILKDRIARLSSSIERALGEAREKETDRRAEEALDESEQRFHRLFMASPDALMLIDPFDTKADWPIVDCNDVACDMNGYSRDELIGKSINILNISVGTPEERAAYVESIRREGVLHLESFHRHRDGHIFPIEISTSMITFKGRELLLGIDRDITGRKRSEEAIRQSEERYRSLFTLSPEALYVHVESRIVVVNPAMCELLGADDPSQLIGKSVLEIVRPEYHEVMRRRWDMISSDQTAPPLEEKFTRLDGSVVDVEVTAVAIDWQGARGVQVIARDITERKRAGAAVRESEERFRMVFESALDGIAIYDQDPDPFKRRLIECNERYAAMAGRSRDELLRLGHTFGLMRPLDERTNEDRLESIAKGTPFWGSFSWIRPDGKENIVEYVGVPVIWRGKHLTIGIDRDITERKRTEEELQELNQRDKDALSIARMGHWEFEIATAQFTFNDQYYELHGTTAEEAGGYTMSAEQFASKYVHPQYASSVREDIRQAVETKDPDFQVHKEVRILRADGQPREVAVWFRIEKDAQGRTTKLLGVNQDITERKKAEEAKRENDIMLELALSAANMAWWKMDIPTGNVSFEKRKAEMLGFPPERFTHYRDFMKLVHPEDHNKAMDSMRRHIDGSSDKYEVEYRIMTASGDYLWFYDVGSITNRDSSGKPLNVAGLVINITERKRAEDALRQSQKLESIGTLAGGIAHDFNNLLNAILGQSTLAINKLSNENPAKSHIEKSVKAAERAADLTRHLLAYSGQGKFVTEEIDLNRLVKENIQILEVSVPKTVQLMFELDPSSPHIRGDISQIQQVVMNLIINGGEAIAPNPGAISVRTGRIALAENDAEYWKYTNTPLQSGNYAFLRVTDTGGGIKPGVLSRIFDPFFSTKFTGRGLGLAAVLGIVRGHQGGLRIASKEGEGSEFEVIFPLLSAPTAAGEPVVKMKTVVDGKGKSVLVIDDEPSAVELLRDVFSDANFKVIEALNPVVGIELYRRHQKSIAAVVLDFSMPGMDGKAAFEELMKIDNNVKVILCSGYSEEEMRSGFGDLRPCGFIKKPYKPHEIVEFVSNITLNVKS